jgi:hypothetical protein
MKNKLAFILFAAIFASCDYVENPIEEGDGPNPEPTGNRTAIIMDFTGHNCPNCPGGAVEALNIQEDLGVFVIAVHGDFPGLTNPVGGEPGDALYTDWRTDEGIALQQIYDIPFIPSGVVSGLNTGGTYWQTVQSWRGLCEELVAQTQKADITFDMTFNEVNGELSGDVAVELFEPFDGDLKLVLAVVEDSIVDWQLNGNEVNPSNPEYEGGLIDHYVHRHVLRGHLNGDVGSTILSGAGSEGDTFTTAVNATISSEYAAEHTEIYAYIYDATTLEILHVASFHLVE